MRCRDGIFGPRPETFASGPEISISDVLLGLLGSREATDDGVGYPTLWSKGVELLGYYPHCGCAHLIFLPSHTPIHRLEAFHGVFVPALLCMTVDYAARSREHKPPACRDPAS